jgi:N-acyl-D-aspartate/D-glutamate deacylase
MTHLARGLLRSATLAAVGFACHAAPGPHTVAPVALSPPYDVVIEGGRIVDGSGNAWFYGDLAITRDRIARIAPAGALRSATARQRVDAHGLVVAPGFIDIQAHSRDALLTGDGRVVGKATQGVTTEIMGEGWTNAPMNDRVLQAATSDDPSDTAYSASFRGEHGFDAWLRAMERHGMSVNAGSFLGAATVRIYAKGMAAGAPTPAELDTMRAVTRRAMADGSFGVASALIYPPGNFATTEELVEIAKAMSPYGGVYITHMRSEADQFLEAIDEAIRIGREGSVPVEIYHLKAAGRRNWPKAAAAISKIDSARARGLDVQADMYPYVAGGTGLAACLPPWVSADGKLFENLRDSSTRARITAELLSERTAWENLCSLATPEGVLVLGLRKPENSRWVGKRLAEVATEQHKRWPDAAIDLLLSEQRDIGTIFFLMSEDNVALQLRQPWIKIGTDAGGYDPDSARGLTHPRSYGTYPRILGRYVREQRVISLEDAVRKMSGAVATRLSIRDRGVLAQGYYADVVVFDPATIIDRATFEQPHQLSTGVQYVFVNGVAVVSNGRHTGAKPGRLVRGPGYCVTRCTRTEDGQRTER